MENTKLEDQILDAEKDLELDFEQQIEEIALVNCLNVNFQ